MKESGSKVNINDSKAAIKHKEGAIYELDLVVLFRLLWDAKFRIIKYFGASVIVGLAIAFGSPLEFKSEVEVMPELSQGSGLGKLGSLAKQFGVSAATANGQMEGIGPDLYPGIIKSDELMQQVLRYEVRIPGEDEKATLFEYFDHIKKDAPIEALISYTIGIPFTLLDWIKGDGDSARPLSELLPEKSTRLVNLSLAEWLVMEELKDRISANMNMETGIVSIEVKMPDPIMAADVADQVARFLEEFIVEYRTQKARRDAEFVEERYNDARIRFQDAQQKLATFRYENRGKLTVLAETREQMLLSEYDIAFSVYNNMAERLEEARIKLQEDTPVITVLSKASVPGEKSAPNRPLVMIITTILFLIVGTIRILGSQNVK